MQPPDLNRFRWLIGQHVRDHNHFGIKRHAFLFPQDIESPLQGFFRVVAEGNSVRIQRTV